MQEVKPLRYVLTDETGLEATVYYPWFPKVWGGGSGGAGVQPTAPVNPENLPMYSVLIQRKIRGELKWLYEARCWISIDDFMEHWHELVRDPSSMAAPKDFLSASLWHRFKRRLKIRKTL